MSALTCMLIVHVAQPGVLLRELLSGCVILTLTIDKASQLASCNTCPYISML